MPSINQSNAKRIHFQIFRFRIIDTGNMTRNPLKKYKRALKGTPENKKDLALMQSLDNQSGEYRNRTDDLLTACENHKFVSDRLCDRGSEKVESKYSNQNNFIPKLIGRARSATHRSKKQKKSTTWFALNLTYKIRIGRRKFLKEFSIEI